jgi:hypothetical protein
MKQGRSWLMKLKSFISVQTYKRPFLFVLSIMISLNIFILLVASIVALIIDDTFVSFIDAFVNGSLKWMLTPNAILDISSPQLLTLAVIVLMTGMVLFSGTIIALTTNQIRDYFQKQKSGSGKIHLNNHIVILNWNNKVPELIADLIHLDTMSQAVVVLATVDKNDAEKAIMNAVLTKTDKPFKSLSVLVKSGSPLLQDNLANVSINQAKAVIIMNNGKYDVATDTLSKSDVNVVKTILTVGRLTKDTSLTLIAEVKAHQTKQKIETMHKVVSSLKSHTILPVCFDRRLGQIIAQTILHPLMEMVYLSMFSFDGSEVYRLKNTSFDDCRSNHPYAIPIGTLDDDVFVLSKDFVAAKKKRKTELNINPIKLKPKQIIPSCRIIIMGHNNKLPFIIEAFEEYQSLYKKTFDVLQFNPSQMDEVIDLIRKDQQKTIVLLLSDESSDVDSLDANVLNNLLNVQTELKREDVEIIVELLDPNNDVIIQDFDIHNTIISNKIISLLLSKLALFPETALFYEQLLSFEITNAYQSDYEIVIYDASDLIQESLPKTFNSALELTYALYDGFNAKTIPLGIHHEGELMILSDYLEHNTSMTIHQADEVICMNLTKKTQ